jgi:hypothetical protein
MPAPSLFPQGFSFLHPFERLTQATLAEKTAPQLQGAGLLHSCMNALSSAYAQDDGQ